MLEAKRTIGRTALQFRRTQVSVIDFMIGTEFPNHTQPPGFGLPVNYPNAH